MRFSLEAVRRAEHARGSPVRADADGAEVVGVARVSGGEIVIAATREARAISARPRRSISSQVPAAA